MATDQHHPKIRGERRPPKEEKGYIPGDRGEQVSLQVGEQTNPLPAQRRRISKKGALIGGLAAATAVVSIGIGLLPNGEENHNPGTSPRPGTTTSPNPEAAGETPEAIPASVDGMLAYCEYLIEDSNVQAVMRQLVPGATDIYCESPAYRDENNPVAVAPVSDEQKRLTLTIFPASEFNTEDPNLIPLNSGDFKGAAAYGGAVESMTLPYVTLISPHGAAILLYYSSQDASANPTPAEVEGVYQLAQTIAENRF